MMSKRRNSFGRTGLSIRKVKMVIGIYELRRTRTEWSDGERDNFKGFENGKGIWLRRFL